MHMQHTGSVLLGICKEENVAAASFEHTCNILNTFTQAMRMLPFIFCLLLIINTTQASVRDGPASSSRNPTSSTCMC